jgi:hypothetical protein
MARRTIDRRTVIGAAALASLPFAPALAQNRPIKFGLLAAKTGPLAESGIDMEQYDDVSQFWAYDEAWFLAQPVYSRDYPQSKYSG